jgi:hypothetical protein
MTNPENPLRPRILDLFTENALKDTAAKGTLTNVVALCAGAQHGAHHFARSFDTNEPVLGLPINREIIETRIGLAFTAIERANALMPAGWVPDGRKKRGEFNVARYLAAILYDLLPHGTPGALGYEPAPTTTDPILAKWARIIADDRQGIPGAQMAVTVPGANNTTALKLRKMSKQVEFYLEHGRMPNEIELAQRMQMTAAEVDDFDDDSVDDDA